MIHECKIHCHTMDLAKAELMGFIDQGKWLPFAFHMDMVSAIKMTSDDEEEPTYNCTTVFGDAGETYIIDTPYKKFLKIWQDYVLLNTDDMSEQEEDLEL